MLYIQGVQEKLCFFTIHCNPSLTYIAIRDPKRSQRNASVQSQPIATECWLGRGGNLGEFLKKNRIFN